MEDIRVDVLTSATPEEAALLHKRLQEAGIQASLIEEEPVRIQVAEKDAEAAREVLAAQVKPPSTAELIDRAFKAAVLGLIVWPIEFYAFGLLTKVFLDEKEGPSAQREKILQTLIMSLPLMMLQVFLLWMLVTAVLDYF